MQKQYPYMIILMACLVSYCNIFSHGLSLDDPYILTQLPDPATRLSGVFSVFYKLYGHADYRPVVVFSYALEQYLFGGINLAITHGINLLFFMLISITIYQIILLLPLKDKNKIALLVVLLFVTHPIHSSVVSSIKNRDNLLSMLFGLLAWYFSLRAIQKRGFLYGLLAALFLTIAVFAKIDALSFLFIIPVSVLIFFPESWKKAAPALILLFLAFAARAIASVYFPPQPNSVTFTENPIVQDWTLVHRITQSLQTFYHYIQFMILPKGYWFYFGYNTLPIPELFSFETGFYFLINLAIVAGIFYFWRKEKIISFGILFFYLALLYCSNFPVPVAGIIADRYAFIASLGFCIAFTGIVIYMTGHYIPSKKIAKGNRPTPIPFSQKLKPYSSYIIIGVICIINMGFTINRNKDWKNTATMLEADMPHLSNSFEANRIAASNYFKKGMEITNSRGEMESAVQQGLEYALQAQKVDDKNQYINESIGQAYFNLGDADAATAQLRNTLKQFDTSWISMDILGDIYFLANEPDSAIYFYGLLIKTAPTNNPAYFKYMRALFKKNDMTAAKSFSDSLLKKYPDWYIPYQCASFYLMEKKDSLNGLKQYKISFDKGYKNTTDAMGVQAKLLRFGDTLDARAMKKYITE